MYITIPLIEKLVVVEIRYPQNTFMISLIDGEEYTIISDNLYCKHMIEFLVRLNKEYINLVLDVGHQYALIINMIKEYGLNYSISTPTKEQVRLIERDRLTLIGLYAEGRKLIKNDNLYLIKTGDK